MNGFICVDKPQGCTSSQVVVKIKRLLRNFDPIQHRKIKVGHTGTLDPMATGVLLVAIGKATVLSDFFLHGEKTYRAILQLGCATTTGDSEGAVMQRQIIPPYDLQILQNIAQQLQGTQQQIPPMYSALKHNGKPLYVYARAGETIPRKPRQITVHHLEIQPGVNTHTIAITVHCSGGTYVRALAETIAHNIGTCGHLTALRRIKSGNISIKQAYSIDYVAKQIAAGMVDDLLMPMNIITQYIPCIKADKHQLAPIAKGQAITIPNKISHGRVALILQPENEVVALCDNKADGIFPKRLLQPELL